MVANYLRFYFTQLYDFRVFIFAPCFYMALVRSMLKHETNYILMGLKLVAHLCTGFGCALSTEHVGRRCISSLLQNTSVQCVAVMHQSVPVRLVRA